MDNSVLLGQYADLINQHGLTSREAQDFLAKHVGNAEFTSLARMAGFVRCQLDQYQNQKESLTVPVAGQAGQTPREHDALAAVRQKESRAEPVVGQSCVNAEAH